MAAQEHRVWYQDEAQDWIVIADDDDLQMAYETAQDHFKGSLKVFVKPVEDKKKSKDKKKTNKVAEKAEPKSDDGSSSSDGDADGKDYELMKSMIQETIKKQTGRMMEEFSDINKAESQSNFVSEDLSNQIDTTTSHQKQPPADLNESVYPNEVHPNVACDGCDMFPIVGVRYKCSVLKNFDYCEKCEATKDHKYAFLKIKRAGDAPKAIFTTIDDRMPAPADIEVDDPQALMKNFFGHFATQDP